MRASSVRSGAAGTVQGIAGPVTDLTHRLDSAAAMAVALASIPGAGLGPGRGAVGVGLGAFGGASAIAGALDYGLTRPADRARVDSLRGARRRARRRPPVPLVSGEMRATMRVAHDGRSPR